MTVLTKIFKTKENEYVKAFKGDQLVQIVPQNTSQLSQSYTLYFFSGKSVVACLDEDSIIQMFYTNRTIYESLGKEMATALDVAHDASGCEAIV